MWIICLADDSHEMSSLVIKKTQNQMVSTAVVIGAIRLKMLSVSVTFNPKYSDSEIADDIFFFHFPRKQGLTFLANCRRLCLVQNVEHCL